MWTRKELKEKSKEALKRNYWKAVLVSLILIILGDGIITAAAAGGRGNSGEEAAVVETDEDITAGEGITAGEEITAGEGITANEGITTDDGIMPDRDRVFLEFENRYDEAVVALEQVDENVITVYAIVFGVIILTVVLVIIAFAVLKSIFFTNPLCVGAGKFMLRSVDDKGNIADLGFAFDHNYMNAVKTTFIRELLIFLWSLLLVIPGLYKKYQYYMVDYILAENPNMQYKEVLERSKKIMEGQKWNAFVLDLSFILWRLLGIITCGLSEILYVKPYINLTRASLYRALTDNKEQ